MNIIKSTIFIVLVFYYTVIHFLSSVLKHIINLLDFIFHITLIHQTKPACRLNPNGKKSELTTHEIDKYLRCWHCCSSRRSLTCPLSRRLYLFIEAIRLIHPLITTSSAANDAQIDSLIFQWKMKMFPSENDPAEHDASLWLCRLEKSKFCEI